MIKDKLRELADTSLLDIKRYVQNKRKKAIRDKLSKKLINEYCNNYDIKKLQIGCGDNLLEGWLNTDLIYAEKIAYLDASKKFPLLPNSFDYVFSEHIIEHLNYNQQLIMLSESYKVLKKDGKIRIVTPSFDFLYNLYEQNTELHSQYINWSFNNFLSQKGLKTNEYKSNAIYVINNFVRDWGHQLLHNEISLKELLQSTGFKDIIIEQVNQSVDEHLHGIERHGNSIPEQFNELESMVITAQKN